MSESYQNLALRVPKHLGETARSMVRRLGLGDGQRDLVLEGGSLEIPVKRAEPGLASLGSIVVQVAPKLSRRLEPPFELIRKETGILDELAGYLPTKWTKLGHVLLLRFPEELRPYQETVCSAYAKILGAAAVLHFSEGIHGQWRKPTVELLWGRETTTIHKENGVLFELDIKKVMFSAGNIGERVRMAKVCSPGEVIVDMFAGIGYFSIPMAVHSGPSRVYACEVNPDAHHYLRRNIYLNEAYQVKPMLGDCRKVAPENVADRVVMGYLESTHRFLPKAFRVLRDGGWIHYHEGCPDELAHRLLKRLREVAESGNYKIERTTRRRVKSYAPGVSHWVVDAKVTSG